MASDCGCLFFPPEHRLPRKYGLGAVALRYAALGYAVLPLVRGGKRPHRMLGDRGGVHHASREPGDIMDWWSLDMAANIGVACGAASRLVVIDLDMKHGSDGIAELGAFREAWGLPMPPAPTARTPSGGWHAWLRWPDGGLPGRDGILPGVDVKGDGGYVVVPPSMRLMVPHDRSGGTTGEVPVPYEWIYGCPHWLPDAPAWLAPWLESAPPAPRPHSGEDEPQAQQPLDAVLERYLKDGIPQGMRNREMYRIACWGYRKWGTDAAGSSQVLALARDIWGITSHAGFGWTEVLTCLESARRFVARSREADEARNAQFMRWVQGRLRSP